ncbi:hypothetical protein FF1_018807 [Malus domestica]
MKRRAPLCGRQKSKIFTNSSACRLKLGDLEGALLDTNFALRDWEDNVKALFRQCQVIIFNWQEFIKPSVYYIF